MFPTQLNGFILNNLAFSWRYSSKNIRNTNYIITHYRIKILNLKTPWPWICTSKIKFHMLKVKLLPKNKIVLYIDRFCPWKRLWSPTYQIRNERLYKIHGKPIFFATHVNPVVIIIALFCDYVNAVTGKSLVLCFKHHISI